MSRQRINLKRDRDVKRFQLISVALAIALDDDEEDFIVLNGLKRRRTHAFWMSPYLQGRTDSTQRNTLCKLEADFLRVSKHIMTTIGYLNIA